MAYAATSREPSLKTTFAWSVVLHIVLFVFVAVAILRAPRGELWGGPGGGAVTIGLVRNIAGVPLPTPEAVTTSRVVDETRGLHKAEPKPPEPPAPEVKIPEFTKSKRPKYVTRPSKVLEDEAPPPPGAIPYGQGGAPSLPYTQFTMAGQTGGGLGFSGPGGDFAGRFPWYVEAVRRRISSNWLYSAIDPSVRWAPRVVVTFQILPDGTVTNLELLRASGIDSVDRSAIRAVRDSSPLERLPPGYGGSNVAVEFWFDFRR